MCFDRSRSLRSLRKGTKNLIFLENHKAELESEIEEEDSKLMPESSLHPNHERASGKAGYVRRDSTRYPQVGEDTSYDSTWEIQVHAHRLCRFAFPWSRRIFSFLLSRRVDRDTR